MAGVGGRQSMLALNVNFSLPDLSLNIDDFQIRSSFTVTNLTLTKNEIGNMVYMASKLKRKIATELLTTYLTIMLVMTTIFTSKIEELPPTSDMKMIDIWLIFCLVVPFLEVILRTAIECVNCTCHICEPEDADKDKAEEDNKKNRTDHLKVGSPGAWTLTGAKVTPQQVTNFKDHITFFCHRL